MLEKARELLAALGFTVAVDDALLVFIENSVTERVKNETNQSEIPEGLEYLSAEMVVGEYLNLKKNSGELEGFDTEAAIKQIQEGDTNITFALGAGSSTPEQRLDNLINYLINGRTREFIRYRRVIW